MSAISFLMLTRCAFCGNQISESNHDAGNFETRADGRLMLHKNDYCAPMWDREFNTYQKELVCVECGETRSEIEDHGLRCTDGSFHLYVEASA